MMSQLSCMSSERWKKDVIDASRRPSRRHRHRHRVVAAHEMKMVLQQSYFGGKPLPLPRPEDAGAIPRVRKHSPAGALVVWKAEQDHPSPASTTGDVPTPPPPWFTSSCYSLSDSSSPPFRRSSPAEIARVPAQSTLNSRSATKPLSDAPALMCPASILNNVKVVALQEEIKRACHREHDIVLTGRGESCVITGWFQGEHDDDEARKLFAVVWKHRHSRQGWDEWARKVKLISRVEDQHVCRLQGYSGACAGDEQILVYEHVCRGSLSDYLFGSLCKALLDWRSRVWIALGAARALAYLHNLAPVDVVYKDFKSSNILLDLDFSVKLAGHGLDVIIAGKVDDKLNKSAVVSKREASKKRNIGSFGVLLLELLSGKAVACREFDNDESLLAQWAKPHLEGGHPLQLASILDPQLRRQLPCPGLTAVAALARQCCRMDTSKRPSSSQLVDVLAAAMALLPICNPQSRPATSTP